MSTSPEIAPDARYPIGRFAYVPASSKTERDARIATIAALPKKLRTAVAGLSDAQLDTPYRTGGWTIRQVVHHIPDSHMNSYVRFKLALTEDEPVIKLYDEDLWSQLADSRLPVEVSLVLLAALHERWVVLLRSLTEEQWQRNMRHPAMGVLSVEKTLALYTWHGEHHLAHILHAPVQR